MISPFKVKFNIDYIRGLYYTKWLDQYDSNYYTKTYNFKTIDVEKIKIAA